MGFFSRFEKHVEDGFEGAADKMFDAPISPVQISKKAEKAMRREKMVGAGRQYAPTLYTVLVNPQDDQRLFGYYPTLAGETETYLAAKAAEAGLTMDGQPLVRFIVDGELKRGKFDVIAELVAAPIVAQLRQEEMQRYGIAEGAGTPAPANNADPYGYGNNDFPYVPEEEIDRSLDYGEYTFNSEDFQRSQQAPQQPANNYAPAAAAAPAAPAAAGYGAHQAANAAAPGYPAGGAPRQAAPSMGNRVPAAPVPQPVPAPAPSFISPKARLTNISSNQIFDLNGRPIVMGRGADATFPIGDIHASRRHAKMQYDPEQGWIITDLNSANGTKVNGQAVPALVLQDGDRITIGLTNFLFNYRR